MLGYWVMESLGESKPLPSRGLSTRTVETSQTFLTHLQTSCRWLLKVAWWATQGELGFRCFLKLLSSCLGPCEGTLVKPSLRCCCDN